MHCLEEDEQQAEASFDVPPPLQIIVMSVPFVSFLSISFLSLLPTSPPSFLSLLKDFKFHSVGLLSEVPLSEGPVLYQALVSEAIQRAA